MSCICDSSGNPILPDWTTYRLRFPQFADPTKYPDALLDMYWEEVTCFVSDANYGNIIGDCRLFLLQLLVAHMMTISAQAQAGKQGGFITSSTIDKVSVTRTAPPSPDMFSWWLGQTAYGQQVLTLLQIAVAGGDYVGGLGETAAFRRVGGIFFPGGGRGTIF